MKDTATEVKVLVNNLGSSVAVVDQTGAKNKLIAMGRAAVPYLNEYLQNDKRTYVRLQIAFVLGKIQDESAIPALEQAAASPYPALNKAAVRALGAIGGEQAAGALDELQRSTTDQELIAAIKEAKTRSK